MSTKEWPLWEVFIRSKQGLNHKHVGSLRAADSTMALDNARDVYTRRSEGISIWVVESNYVHANDPADADAYFEPSDTKIFRHPTFYEVHEGIKHM
jgi:ring-1,2-phenylacetyl-CoA epoxidase subunit PaaB